MEDRENSTLLKTMVQICEQLPCPPTSNQGNGSKLCNGCDTNMRGKENQLGVHHATYNT